MTKYREILRLWSQGVSKSGIAQSCECSRNTVKKVVEKAADLGLSWPLEDEFSDTELHRLLITMKPAKDNEFKMPDYDYVHREMAKSGVTLKLLWHEYRQACGLSGEKPYMYTQFRIYYREWAHKSKATMRIHHKPGEKMETDWAGKHLYLKDNLTGDKIKVSIFAAVLPCSGYTFVEGYLNQGIESWITGHVNAFSYFGGATRIIVPDNLRTGVTEPDWHTPTINKTYREMAEHYGVAVIPARVKKPRDKASIESTVNVVTRWIIAALRNRQFFSIVELNGAIREKLAELNRMPFQKKPGNRLAAFDEEREHLLPLPKDPYELTTWKTATIMYNYHVSVLKQNYSAPHEYIKKKVDIRITRHVVEIIYENNRIASHRRLYGHEGQYSTVVEHMPPRHQKYLEWDGDRFRRWANGIGANTFAVVDALLCSFKVEQQGYKSCMGLLKLADKHSVDQLEAACEKALSYTINPGYRNVASILKTNSENQADEKNSGSSSEYGFTRGAEYYGRKDG